MTASAQPHRNRLLGEGHHADQESCGRKFPRNPQGINYGSQPNRAYRGKQRLQIDVSESHRSVLRYRNEAEANRLSSSRRRRFGFRNHHIANLTARDRESLSCEGDEITITREFSQDPDRPSGAYFTEALVNLDFAKCRAESKATPKRAIYEELREKYELPKVSNADQIEAHLAQWETDNTDKLTLERMGRLLGFTNVAAGKIKEATSFHLIPAVQSAADELDNERASPIRSLISQIARDTIENRKEFAEFKAKTNAELAALTSPDKIPSLKTISQRLTNLLTQYYADSKLHATWNPLSQLPITFPSARVEIEDNDFVASIDVVGHGLQRAALFAVLEYMARSNFEGKNEAKAGAFDEPQSDIIIAIEEPEIYQHPSKQRLLYDAFQKIVANFNKETGIRVQILYATHSNLFLQIQDVESIRVCRRNQLVDEKPVEILATTLETCADVVATAKGVPSNIALFRMSLHTFTPEIAEGFFSKVSVLVEGITDKVILLAYYRHKGIDPLSRGIFIVAADGKTKMDKPIIIFRELGLPCYFVFDNDSAKAAVEQRSQYNRLLQKLGGTPDHEIEDFPARVTDRYFAMPKNLEAYIRSKADPNVYNDILAQISGEFALNASESLKSPIVAASLFARLVNVGTQFPELEDVFNRINVLAGIN